MKVSVGQMVEKECLFGGRSTSEVYRIGDVLYRTSCRNSELYVPLLRFFEERGVTETYRYLGNDGKGHDMFSFLRVRTSRCGRHHTIAAKAVYGNSQETA